MGVSLPGPAEFRGRVVSAGVLMRPAGGRALVRRLGLTGAGRRACGPAVVGTRPSAPTRLSTHYARRSGESLTAVGLAEGTARQGGIPRVGGVLLQVTQPRHPR